MRHLYQGINVQDQAHPAVPEHGGSGEEILMLKRLAQAFDDDFLFANQLIHEQSPRGVARLKPLDDAA